MPDPDDHPAGMTRVVSAVMPDGSYGVEISVGEDLAFSLGPGAVLRYTRAVVAASVAAEHDWKAYAALRETSMPEELIGQLIEDHRQQRGQLNKATGPLRFVPGVGLMTGRPFVHVYADRVEPWQWSPAAARHHAMNVLTVLAAVELDASLRTMLVDYGVPEHSAMGLIHAMSGHVPGEDPGPHEGPA